MCVHTCFQYRYNNNTKVRGPTGGGPGGGPGGRGGKSHTHIIYLVPVLKACLPAPTLTWVQGSGVPVGFRGQVHRQPAAAAPDLQQEQQQHTTAPIRHKQGAYR